MRLVPVFAPVFALSLAALPVLGDGLTCPPGWEAEATACDPAECVAPMGGGLIRVDRYASVPGTTLTEAFDSLERAVSADGTPLHDLVEEHPVEHASLAGLRRRYAGAARGMDLSVTLVLVRDGGEDVLLRAMWNADQDALLAPMVAPSNESWDPRPSD